MAHELDPSRLCAAFFIALVAGFTVSACNGYESPRCLTDGDCDDETVCWTGGDTHECVQNCTDSQAAEACTPEEICTQPNRLSEQRGCVPRAEYRSDAGSFDSGGDTHEVGADAPDRGGG